MDDIEMLLEYKRQELNRGCGVNVVVLVVVAIVASMLAVGCKTPTEVVRTDTVLINRTLHDSIYIETHIRDSVVERQRGDTILIERWRTQYRDRWHERIRHDTTYISRVDTVSVPVKPATQPLSWWQQTRIHVGGITIFAVVLFILYKCVVLLLKKKFSSWL